MPVYFDKDSPKCPLIVEFGGGAETGMSDIGLTAHYNPGGEHGALAINGLDMPVAIGEILAVGTARPLRESQVVLWFNSLGSLNNMIHMLESIRPAFTPTHKE